MRITGGEPTVRRIRLEARARFAAGAGIDELSLSNDGHLLSEWRRRARGGIARSTSASTRSTRTASARITRLGDVARVRAGIEAARAAGFEVIKINTVAVKGFNDGEIGALCDFAWSRGLYPRFIEQMPMAGGEMSIPVSLLSAQEIRDRVAAAWLNARLSPDEGGGGARGAGPARDWRLDEPGGGPGGVSVPLGDDEYFRQA